MIILKGLESEKLKIGIVVSMGTGDIPTKQVPVGDIFIPDSITGNKINTIKHIKYHIYILFIYFI